MAAKSSRKQSETKASGPPENSGSSTDVAPPIHVGSRPHYDAIGLVEVFGFTPSMVALDAMEKSADVRLLQIELNDMLGVVVKIVGSLAAVETAVRVGHEWAEKMQGRPVSHVIRRPDPLYASLIDAPVEYNPLIQQNVVVRPELSGQANPMEQIAALGFIETQGFTAVFEAIDTACKAANVDVVGKEKLGGGYVTIVIKGDVAAVKAAVEAARGKVEGLGKLIAAHVVTRPSAGVISLLPKA
jgi:carbon dioxide concentrating mechanism protein CcmO